MVGNDVDSSADNDGIDGSRVGLAVAAVPGTATEAGPGGGNVGGATDSSGTEAIDAAGGTDMYTGGRILPTCERENGDISHIHPIKRGGELPTARPTLVLRAWWPKNEKARVGRGEDITEVKMETERGGRSEREKGRGKRERSRK